MGETKSLCAKIPVELHNKVREKQEESGVTLNQYVEQIITEYYEMKEMKSMAQTRTLALQISEELFSRIKRYVDNTPHLTQKAFITEVITKALDELEQSENTNE
ncbi:toxin-antitoxin system HicB family antitoxin [Anaerotignum sp.]|uniref:toxin-antitoxin system HicB family antitoxin n=1 Tax=Anaerotignum sp. TaxID=2039241 RepID=UPI0028A5A357|nr:4-oxalocrotonate tautomerase [Anaerotignum sp.]